MKDQITQEVNERLQVRIDSLTGSMNPIAYFFLLKTIEHIISVAVAHAVLNDSHGPTTETS